MKKVIFLAVVSLFLGACGIEGSSDSSSGFAPKDIAAFEAKFKDQTMTIEASRKTIKTIKVVAGKKIEIKITPATVMKSVINTPTIYKYDKSKTDDNEAILGYDLPEPLATTTVSAKIKCTRKLEWTESLKGSGIEVCGDKKGQGGFNFSFGGSNQK